MKILALIPARGGSKRLPRKNVKLLGGEPLIAWSIKAAQNSQVCVDVMVSTDDEEIARIAGKYGAYVPGLRPSELATDTASSVDVAIYALNEYQAKNGPVDGLLLLQPTSPFRSAETIRKAVQLFEDGDGRFPVVSVSPASCHPAWCFRLGDQGMEPFLGWGATGMRSQDLEPAYMLNGAIYLISPRRLLDERAFLTVDTKAIVIESKLEELDIDTQTDWLTAESMLTELADRPEGLE